VQFPPPPSIRGQASISDHESLNPTIPLKDKGIDSGFSHSDSPPNPSNGVYADPSRATKSATDATNSATDVPTIDADLRLVMDAWAGLPAVVRSGIVAMVKTASKQRGR
jgi:hypothetical protein